MRSLLAPNSRCFAHGWTIEAKLVAQPASMTGIGLRITLPTRQCVDSRHMLAILDCAATWTWRERRRALKLRVIPHQVGRYGHGGIEPIQTVEVSRHPDEWRDGDLLVDESRIHEFCFKEFIIIREGTAACISFMPSINLDIACTGLYLYSKGQEEAYSSDMVVWSPVCR